MATAIEARPTKIGLRDRIGRFALEKVVSHFGVEEDRRKINGNITEDDRELFAARTNMWLKSFMGDSFNMWAMLTVNSEMGALEDLSEETVDKFIRLKAHVSLQDKGFSCLLPRYKGKDLALPSNMERVARTIPA